MFKHILIPTDGSERSRKAMREGTDFAASIKARLTFLTTLPPFKVFATNPMMVTDTKEAYKLDVEKVARQRFEGAVEYARLKGVPALAQHVLAEHPFVAIIDAAKKYKCDLIFMASHGRKGIVGIVLGSETQKVLTHSKIPVLVCR